MTPDQRRWLRRAKELAAQIQRSFGALEACSDSVAALQLHLKTLLAKPEWHGEVLDAFLKDMLLLADCCASLEARLPDDNQGNTQLAWKHILLAGEASTVSRQLLVALRRRFELGTTAPPLNLIKRLALSASVSVRWLPKALRAAAGRELGQATQPAARPSGPDLLQMAMMAATATLLVLALMSYKGPHIDMLHTVLCTPDALASMLGNFAAVYAYYARSPATFKDQAREWSSLALLAAALLKDPATTAVAAAVMENGDMREQLAAALLPYAAHLLKAADLQSASWLAAWRELVPALTSEAVWPDLGGTGWGEARQHSAAVAEGLLRLLRVLPPLGKPPRSYQHARDWIPVPLNTARAAALAATKALEAAGPAPQGQVQAAALREVQQQGFHLLLALLPNMVELLIAAAGQLVAREAGAGATDEAGRRGAAFFAYCDTLMQLLQLMAASSQAFDRLRGVRALPGELAAAGEAALRLGPQATALAQAAYNAVGRLDAVLYAWATLMGRKVFAFLLPAVKQEATAAPELGGVRPSLQAQLHLVHTTCKFVRSAVAPGTAAIPWGSSDEGVVAGELHSFVRHSLVQCNRLLVAHLRAEDVPESRAPLTPAEKRALVGAALSLSATGSAVVRLLPEGPAREAQRIDVCLGLCRLLLEPELAGALLAQHAELAEQIVAGLAAALKISPSQQETEVWSRCECSVAVEQAVQANRRLGPMMLGGAAGEALEAAVRESLQGSAVGVALGWVLWTKFLSALMMAAQDCLDGSGCAAVAVLQPLLQSPARGSGLPQEGWEAFRALRAAADEWLAQEEEQQWRQEQLLLCAEAAATRACSNLACTNLGGSSEAGLKGKHCAGCRCMRYCSTACQRADWAAGHKAVCKRLRVA